MQLTMFPLCWRKGLVGRGRRTGTCIAGGRRDMQETRNDSCATHPAGRKQGQAASRSVDANARALLSWVSPAACVRWSSVLLAGSPVLNEEGQEENFYSPGPDPKQRGLPKQEAPQGDRAVRVYTAT